MTILASQELAKEVFNIIFEVLTLTPVYGEYSDFKELQYDLQGSKIQILAKLSDGREVLVDEFDLEMIDANSTVAEEIVRRSFSLKMYSELLLAISTLRRVLRCVNTTIYARAQQLGVKGEELEESYWYAETLADMALRLLERLEIIPTLAVLRMLEEELVKLVLRFNNLKVREKFGQNLDAVKSAETIEDDIDKQLRKTHHELSAIIHGSRSKLGGSETIGVMRLAFDLRIAHHRAEFLNKDLTRALIALIHLVKKSLKVPT